MPRSSAGRLDGRGSTAFVYPTGALINGNACGLLAASPQGSRTTVMSQLFEDFHYLISLTPSFETLGPRFIGDPQFSLPRIIDYFRSIAEEFKSVFATWKRQFKELTGVLNTFGFKFDEDIDKVHRDVEAQLPACSAASGDVNRDCVLKLAVDLFRHQIAGAIGEIRAAFHLRERVILNDAHLEDITLAKNREIAATLRNEVRKTGEYAHQGKGRISLNEKISNLIEMFTSRQYRSRDADVAFATLKKLYPVLFGQFADHEWLKALRRLRRLEIDLVTVGEETPLAFVEVKSLDHEIDVADLSGTRFSSRLAHAVKQMIELRSLLKLSQLVELSVFFPSGITLGAIAHLQFEYPGLKIYWPGTHVSAPPVMLSESATASAPSVLRSAQP